MAGPRRDSAADSILVFRGVIPQALAGRPPGLDGAVPADATGWPGLHSDPGGAWPLAYPGRPRNPGGREQPVDRVVQSAGEPEGAAATMDKKLDEFN